MLRRLAHVAALIYNFRSTLKQTKKQSFFHWKLNCLDCHNASLNNIHSSICISSTRSNITLVCLLRSSSVNIRTNTKTSGSISMFAIIVILGSSWSHLEAILGPFWDLLGPPRPQEAPRGAKLAPRLPQNGPKLAPRRPKMTPKWLQVTPRWAQKAP